jgi:hypothetical protein
MTQIFRSTFYTKPLRELDISEMPFAKDRLGFLNRVDLPKPAEYPNEETSVLMK